MRELREAREINLPFVALAELRAGFACGARSRGNARIQTRFIGKPRVRLLYPDDGTTHHWANLFRQLRSQGTPIPFNDLWIAALCTQSDSESPTGPTGPISTCLTCPTCPALPSSFS